MPKSDAIVELHGFTFTDPTEEEVIEWLRSWGNQIWAKIDQTRTWNPAPSEHGGRGEPYYDVIGDISLARILTVGADMLEAAVSQAAP